MSDLFTAAENIRKFAFQFDGIMKVAEVLEQLGSLDRLKDEYQAAADAKRAELDKVTLAVNAANSQLESVAAYAVTAQSDVIAASQAKLEEADAEAEAIRAAARADATQLLQGVNAKYDGLTAQANAKLDALQARIADMTAQVEQLEVRRGEAVKAAGEAQSQLDDIQSKIKAMLNS